ncbi:MAG: aldose 1-epimerase family protein [Actinomycetes bacterium]
MTPASGRQTVLVRGSQQAVVVEVGGGLRTYTVGGEAVLDGYDEEDLCAGARGQPLLPWPNRLADGRYEWEGRQLQVPLSEPETATAIHGLTRWSNWIVAEATTASARLYHHLHPRPGYPWSLEVSHLYALGPEGLEVTTTVVNRSRQPAPFGLGFHPYLAAFGGLVDDVELTVPAATSFASDDRGLPTGRQSVAGTEDDFRAGRPVGDRRLNLAVTDLSRGPDGRAVVELRHPRSGRSVRLWVDEAYGFVMLFTGDTLDDIGRRRHGLAVEPMTGPPNLLRTGDGRQVLPPAQPFVARWGIQTS